MEDAKAPDLTKSTASEWLRLLSETAKVNYKENLGEVTGMDGRASFVPENRLLPKVDFTGSVGENQPAVGDLTVSSDLLSYARKYEDLPSGSRTTDTFKGGVGPLKSYYSESSQPGNQDSRTTAYGGRLNLGPVSLYADRNRSSQDVVDPRFAQFFQNTRSGNQTDQVGLNLRLPVGSGAVTGGVGRKFQTQYQPQQLRQETRPTAQSPNVTTFGAGYEGKVGQGILSLQGNLTDVEKVGTDKSVQASYNVYDPFGLGGSFSAKGSYNNPPGGKSAADALFEYKLKFGGGR